MTLRHIQLRDFVVVQSLELDLHTGFNVLTGETGAGKSILVDALQLALGARAEASCVREGARRCDISAEFDNTPALHAWLEASGVESHDVLLLRRSVDAQGKSRAWINGVAATTTQLRAAADFLVDIYGQHAWQNLTRPASVRDLLDTYAQCNPQAKAVQASWQQWRDALAVLERARATQGNQQRERERLLWQIGELEKLVPAVGEWDELNTRHTRLSHAQTLMDAARHALMALEGDENDRRGHTGATPSLVDACALLQAQAHLEPAFAAVADVLASALAQAEDAVHSLRTYLRHTELDPQDYAAVDERVSQWVALARRYRHPPEALPALWQGWKDALQALELASDLRALEHAETTALQIFETQAHALSQCRSAGAPRLSQTITQAMQGLGMQGGRFAVKLHPLPNPAAHGMEDVEFLVASHPGSSLRPVGKVASGGELSRLALAIAVSTSQLGSAQTLLFDEVDSGVGGAVAQTVGKLMRQLGEERQVLAVTHLPQVAACAQHHFVVNKLRESTGPTSTVSEVTQEPRVLEIARMLGGEHLTDATLAHAREMLGH